MKNQLCRRISGRYHKKSSFLILHYNIVKRHEFGSILFTYL